MESFLNQIQQTSWIEWLGTATGIIGVLLSIREKALAWPLFIICYSLYALLSYQASLPAAMILNSAFIPISIYGWWKWTRPTQTSEAETTSTQSVSIARIGLKQGLILILVMVLLSILLGKINTIYIKGNLPYLDAFATIISFAAQWMLSRKYLENWTAWIVADFAFILLWGLQGYWVAVLMFSVFIVLAIAGWLSWRKGMNRNA